MSKRNKIKKRKLNEDGFVYSTNNDFNFENKTFEEASNKEQNLTVHIEKKNRAGKTVTIIKGFTSNQLELKILEKDIKSQCSTGGTSKNKEIIIQGNNRNKIIEILEKKGFNVKKVGS